MPIVDEIPLIGILLKRLKKVKKIDKIIVATSKNKENDSLVKFLEKNKYNFFKFITRC